MQKLGSQETPEVTGKFSLGVHNEARQRLIVLPRERIGHSKHLFQTTQEKAKVNTTTLGISDLKSMGMGKFNSDDHYI